MWIRKGRIFEPVISHAQCPTVLVMEDRLRIFYADRMAGRSFITYFDTSRGDPSRIINAHHKPIMDLGKLGTFDDDGMMPSCVVPHDGFIYLYYSGWNRGVTVPYRNSTGLAVSMDGGNTFARMFEGPVMDRTAEEPYCAVTPWVMIDSSGFWTAWYVSGTGWEDNEPLYVIKAARSHNGVHWVRYSETCIQPFPNFAEVFSNPTVIRTPDDYRMWFCSRGTLDYRDGSRSYYISMATSKDGQTWNRTNERYDGLEHADEGWDSTMTCYPYVIEVDGRRLMFYNGNGFGQSGIGFAEWSE